MRRENKSDPQDKPRPDGGARSDLRSLFGFHGMPFTREIRADELFSLPFLDEAFEGLLRAVEARMPAALIAPAGSGKSAVLRRLRAHLPEARYQVCDVKLACMSKRETCREIATAFGVAAQGSYPVLVRRLQERFDSLYSNEGRKPLLIIDEAHEFRADVIGMLRILTNFDLDSRLVLSVVLAGQPPLKALLMRDDQEAVAKRMMHVATLRLLSRDESEQYVEHRCTIAGAVQVPFDAQSLDALYEMTRGNLRALDMLALKSLEIAARAGAKVVSSNHIVGARKDLWP